MRGISHVIVDEIHERDINVRCVPFYFVPYRTVSFLSLWLNIGLHLNSISLQMQTVHVVSGAWALFLLAMLVHADFAAGFRPTSCWCCWETWWMLTPSWGSSSCQPLWTPRCSPSTLGTVRWSRCTDAPTRSRVRTDNSSSRCWKQNTGYMSKSNLSIFYIWYMGICTQKLQWSS